MLLFQIPICTHLAHCKITLQSRRWIEKETILSTLTPTTSSKNTAHTQEHIQAQFNATYASALAQRSDADSTAAKQYAYASACRDIIAARWVATQQQDAQRTGARRVHYLSMEFLMGRALQIALSALSLNTDSTAFATIFKMCA